METCEIHCDKKVIILSQIVSFEKKKKRFRIFDVMYMYKNKYIVIHRN